MFQFPSNGKAHSDDEGKSPHSQYAGSVSIPFKREGTFRHTLEVYWVWSEFGEGFNSLQTGRHIQTYPSTVTLLREHCVSIPFKREGTFRHEIVAGDNADAGVIVSIPFKREGTFRPTLPTTDLIENQTLFQFPSNGKAHSDCSIILSSSMICSFNSLQTGRHIQTVPQKK